MTGNAEHTRLMLVTPPEATPKTFAAPLREALAGGDVAAVLIAQPSEVTLEDLAKALIPIVQEVGAAAIVAGDTRVAGRAKADGVHIASGLADLRLAADSFRPHRIVGAGEIFSRHAAMEAGEVGVDYLFFGRPHGDARDEAHPKALELAEWWSELMQIPAVAMGGRSLDSVAAAAATGAAFVALGQAIWANAEGPRDAVRKANALLAAKWLTVA